MIPAIDGAIKAPTISASSLSTQKEEKPTVEPYRASESDLKRYVRELSEQYSVDYQTLVDTIQCESGWRTDVYSISHISYGVAQFTPATWHDYGIGDYKNPYNQLKTMVIMFSKGLAKRWDCWRELMGY